MQTFWSQSGAPVLFYRFICVLNFNQCALLRDEKTNKQNKQTNKAILCTHCKAPMDSLRDHSLYSATTWTRMMTSMRCPSVDWICCPKTWKWISSKLNVKKNNKKSAAAGSSYCYLCPLWTACPQHSGIDLLWFHLWLLEMEKRKADDMSRLWPMMLMRWHVVTCWPSAWLQAMTHKCHDF